MLTSTVVAPIYGELGDLYGRKVMMQISVVLFLLGSALAGLSTTMWFLIASRAIQGVGGCGLFVLALTVIADVNPPRERSKVQGIFGGALFGALFTNSLAVKLGAALPGGIDAGSLNAVAVARLPDGIRIGVVTAFTEALHPIFLISSTAALLALGLTFVLKEIPLRGRGETV